MATITNRDMLNRNDPDEQKYRDMSVAELKRICKARKIKGSNDKDKLIENILDDDMCHVGDGS